MINHAIVFHSPSPRRLLVPAPLGVVIVLGAALSGGTAHAQNAAVTVNVNTQTNRRAINPNIYGIAYGASASLSDLNSPLNRQGGNNTSRYNWQLNADNRANDYYYESLSYPSAIAGEVGDTFIRDSKTAGAQAMLTIPLIDWVAKLGANRGRLSSFSIAKYGAQTGNDWQWFPDAGNGIKSSGGYVTGNDPNDANVPSSAAFQQGWVQHLVSQWGAASAGGLRYYLLDNEASIWFGTHRDVAPTGLTMDQMKTKMIDYAAMIKSVDPSASVVGPEEWGWDGYRYSGYDQQYGSLHNYSSFPDRASHGNMDYVPYLLSQMRQYEIANGKRLLDIFSLHFYPQGGEFSNDTSTAMQQRRNRSTRALWDPNYVDETWINTQVQLIPRMKSWVNSYYPGTPTAITEYNWGAESHINGATTQADIYGIFGREGVDMATRWTTPDPSTPTYKAMKLYRNYDGNKSSFGDTSVLASTANPDNLSAFAATRTSDGALTVMVISKVLSGATPVTVNLANFIAGGPAQVWQLTSANAITHPANVAASTSITLSVPAQSVTLLVIPAAPTATTVYQIDSGGGATGAFVADTYFSGGSTYSVSQTINTTGVPDAAPMAVYQSLRYGNFAYTMPSLTPGTSYTVRLHFAETYFTYAGNRIFNVAINGTNVLTNFDIAAAVGPNKALVKDFTAIADSNGKINIAFTTVLDNAVVNGIEIISSSGSGSVIPPAPTGLSATPGNSQVSLAWAAVSGATSYKVYRSTTNGSAYALAGSPTAISALDAGLTNGTTYYYVVTAVNATGESPNSTQVSATPSASAPIYQIDSGGGATGAFVADTYFSGGSTYSVSQTINTTGVPNAAPMAVYQSLRYGNFAYTMPGLTSGASYTVRLHFAETYFTTTGKRVFTVKINGTNVLTNFDIVAAAGSANKALVKDFTAVADSSGKINITFTTVLDNAVVNGVEIIR
jgi:hypothetical protein